MDINITLSQDAWNVVLKHVGAGRGLRLRDGGRIQRLYRRKYAPNPVAGY